MKLSLTWLFDHIKEKSAVKPLTEEFAQKIATLLGSRTTELDRFSRVTYNLEEFTLAQLREVTPRGAILYSPELNKEYTLESRKDGLQGNWYLLKKTGKQFQYATLQDLHSEKEGLLPALWCSEADLNGNWKQQIDPVDYVISIDNKAITHRPDLWGHRGFAREVAALFTFTLVPEDSMGTLLPIRHYMHQAYATKEAPYDLAIDGTACKRLAVLALNDVENLPSIPWMAFRLARVDSRSLNALVDCTNYVMFDIGQPMHVFDAQKIHAKLEARYAHEKEQLVLLDGETITLSSQDCIIADAQKPLALAGIMGGKESAISTTSSSLIVESANFDTDTIRLSAMRHKHRTESSTRFEKSLDPNQNTFAILRFKRLLDDIGIQYQQPTAIVSLGNLAIDQTVKISHAFIQNRIGTPVSPETITKHLTQLGFGVVADAQEKSTYTVTVPTFRGTKDVLYKEDIVEEIARLIGYENILPHLPSRHMKPFDQSTIFKTRAIKQHCAFGLHMHEVNNYALYDEDFLQKVHYRPHNPLTLKNPVSENWRQMATSLIPHLFKQVMGNVPHHKQVNLFEINNTWQLITGNEIIERKKLGMIFFSYQKAFDFYTGKELLQSLFDVLKMLVIWQKPFTEKELDPWCLPEQTAELVCGDTIIGYAGKASPRWLKAVGEGDAFIVELDAQFLIDYVPEPVRYHPLSKYPSVDLDISLLVPFNLAVDEIKSVIAEADARIINIQLIDFFEKPEWKDHRSITLRFTLSDQDKTLTKEEIDDVWESVIDRVQKKGARVR